MPPSVRKAGKLAGRPGDSSWKIRSARCKSLSRCSPRSRRLTPSGSISRTSSAVADESTTCPPWPALASRAHR